jgi:hypothetical protein
MESALKINDVWFKLNDHNTVYVVTKIHKANFSITNATCKIYKKIKTGTWWNTKEEDITVFGIDYSNWRKLDFP